jgi:hypothetical protein
MWGNGALFQVMLGGFLLHLVMGTVYTYVGGRERVVCLSVCLPACLETHEPYGVPISIDETTYWCIKSIEGPQGDAILPPVRLFRPTDQPYMPPPHHHAFQTGGAR